MSEAVRLNPDDSAAWFFLGAAHHRKRTLIAAKEALTRAIRLEPRHLQAHFALAVVCQEVGDAHAALVASERAVAIAPDDPQAWFNLAVAQEAAGFSENALASYDRAIVLSPFYQDAFKNRVALLQRVGKKDAAVASAQSFAKLLPFSPDAQFILGGALLSEHRHIEAASAFARAATLQPENARALLHAGFALAQCERFDEAQRALDRASALDSSVLYAYRKSIFGNDGSASARRLDARVLFLLRHYDAIERCEWAERDYFLRRFSELIEQSGSSPLTERALGFRAMTMGLSMPLQLSLARQLAAGIDKSSSLPGASKSLHPSRPCSPWIRIGYVSPDFRDHPTGRMVADLFAWHDRDRFQIYGYLLGQGDESEVRSKVESACKKFVDLNGLDDAQAAQMIRDDKIDILVDLAGYTDMSRPGIFSHRPAPLQISWLGYVTTVGAPWIDYLVADPIALPPEHEQFYTEAPIRMPAGQYLCSYAHAKLRVPPARRSAGLPETGRVLGAMHNAYKIDPEIFALWMRLLSSCGDAVLWLLDCGVEANANLRANARAQGIDESRLIFAPKISHAEHLARLQLVDLVLDTPQCNGSSTIADALVVGVPTIACLGETFAQRMAASLLSAAAQDHMVVKDLQRYESLANELIDDPQRLIHEKARIKAAREHALFYRPRDWVKYLESGFLRAWINYRNGEAPRAIEVAA